jgi:hypothetical protein
MVKRLTLSTRAFGAEPGLPGVTGLASWIAEYRGATADIITYLLDRSLAPQIPAGIMTTCAGGKFYAERILQSIAGIDGTRVTGELHLDTQAVVEDAAKIVVQKKGSWCAMPAPHLLHITDSFYHDTDEWTAAVCGVYSTLMRATRDTGVAGHILIGDRMDPAELALLSRQKVFFFSPDTDRENLANLIEYHQQVAVSKDQLGTALELMDEYTLRKIFMIDPDRSSIETALSHLDPDQIAAGGYSADGSESYWQNLAEAATYTR